MKKILTLALVVSSLAANAQNWSIGVAGGSSLWTTFNTASKQYNEGHVRGWDAEAQLRRETKGKWSYNLALNYGTFSHREPMPEVVYFNAPEHNYTHVQRSAQILSARLGANYSFFKNGEHSCPLMNKLAVEAGGFIAPGLIIGKDRTVYNDNGLEGYDYYGPSRTFSLSAGMQLRLSYKINTRLAATFTSATQFDLANIFSGRSFYAFEPDMRCSALLGMAYTLK